MRISRFRVFSRLVINRIKLSGQQTALSIFWGFVVLLFVPFFAILAKKYVVDSFPLWGWVPVVLFVPVSFKFLWREIRTAFVRVELSWPMVFFFAFWFSVLFWINLSPEVLSGKFEFPELSIFPAPDEWQRFVRFCFDPRLGWSGVVLASMVVSFVSFARISRKIGLSDEICFAPDSCSSGADRLGFKEIAPRVAKSLFNDTDFFRTVLVEGEQGFGKSSFIRMIVESLGNRGDSQEQKEDRKKQKEEFLYSYIALTETNEENDLSRLFAERWSETLTRRYPRIIPCDNWQTLADLVRVEGEGFSFRSFFSFLKFVNVPLCKTRTFDGKNVCKERIARVFLDIPRIAERGWVIVFDEIERATPAEIYRMIEIVERFRHLSAAGAFPVRLCFVFAVSLGKLKGILKKADGADRILGELIMDFFLFKSSDRVLPVPLVSSKRRKQFIRELLQKFSGSESSDKTSQGVQERAQEDGEIEESPDPFKQHLDNSLAMTFTVNSLAKDSLRSAIKCIKAAKKMKALIEEGAEVELTPVRLTDYVLMEYLINQFPFMLDFIRSTIGDLDNGRYKERLTAFRIEASADNIPEERKSEQMLAQWVEKALVKGRDTHELTSAVRILAAVAYCYVDVVNIFHTNYVSSGQLYLESFGQQGRLSHYLAYAQEGSNQWEKEEALYVQHNEETGCVFTALQETKDLLKYAEFVSEVNPFNPSIGRETVQELFERLRDGRVKFYPFGSLKGSSKTERYACAKRISLLLLKILTYADRKIDSGDGIDSDTQQVLCLYSDVFECDQIASEIKFSLLHKFRSGVLEAKRDDLEFLFQFQSGPTTPAAVFRWRRAVQHVFEEVWTQYLDGSQNIYEREENVFYLLYNAWSGQNNKNEIELIRNAVKRELSKNGGAIKKLLDYFLEDSLVFSQANRAVLLIIREDLLRFAGELKNDGEITKMINEIPAQFPELKDQRDTLRVLYSQVLERNQKP